MLVTNFEILQCQKHQFTVAFTGQVIAFRCNGGFTQQNTKQLMTYNFTGFSGFDTGSCRTRIIKFVAEWSLTGFCHE